MGISGAARDFVEYLRSNAYAVYVLLVLTLIYMVNQLNTFCLVATNPGMSQEIGYGDKECDVVNETALEWYLQQNNISGTPREYCLKLTDCNPPDESYCHWHYLGRGFEYQLLAGPLYIVLFSISGIPMGLISELNNINRKFMLVGCALLWSLMCLLGGFATEYWHLALTRLLMGIFSAGCVPFCASLISDYFASAQRGSALGLYNWGVYVGYSITFALLIAEKQLGWRNVYFIAGTPGIALGLLTLITVKEPTRYGGMSEKSVSQLSGTLEKLKTAALKFSDLRLLLLCLGGAIRNGAGVVWAYNITIFFDEYHPGTLVEDWMTWIPLVFGSIGAFGGGVLSDKLAEGRGSKGRLLVLISCLILSAPFQVGTLLLPMPWAFIMHIPAYIIGEMWIGVCVAVVIDLVPTDLTASAVAVYFFIIQFIGGNMNVLVPPIETAIGLRGALLIMFPGSYIIGAILFILTLIVVMKKKEQQFELDEKEVPEIKSNEQLVKDVKS